MSRNFCKVVYIVSTRTLLIEHESVRAELRDGLKMRKINFFFNLFLKCAATCLKTEFAKKPFEYYCPFYSWKWDNISLRKVALPPTPQV